MAWVVVGALGLLAPAACGTATTVVGNFTSAKQAPLIWPVVTAYAGATAAALLAVGTTMGLAYTNSVSGNLAYAAGFAVGGLGAIGTTMATTAVWHWVASSKEGNPDSFSLSLFDASSPFIGE